MWHSQDSQDSWRLGWQADSRKDRCCQFSSVLFLTQSCLSSLPSPFCSLSKLTCVIKIEMKVDFEMHPSLIFSFLLAIAETIRASETCYFPNGSEIFSTSTNTTYEACNEIAGATSQCCPGNQGCSANGLCVDNEGQYSRGGCTDSTFDTPYCVSLCSTSFVWSPYQN